VKASPSLDTVETGADLVTIEVIRNRLDVIAEEMQHTLLRSAYSIILKEGSDASCAIFTSDGAVIAQSTSQPLHLGALVPAVQRIIARFPTEGMKEGDVFCLNDPYDGGTHLPDLIVVVPVVHEGRVVALGASLAHHQDFGGMAPGSMTINATEHFQEGLILGPLQLYDADVANTTLFTVIDRNVRVPKQVIGDIRAQVAAGRTVARRTLEMIEEFGLVLFFSVVHELLRRGEQLTRTEIEKLPDGTYTFDDVIDSDGIDTDRRLRIKAAVTIDGSDIRIDFNGTDAQAKGPVNSSPTGALGPAFYVLRAITDASIPNNAGCYVPLSVDIPEGTILHPRRPAPVSIRAQTLKRVVDVLLGALAQAVPGSVPAASHGTLLGLSLGGHDSETGEPWVYMECSVGGTGANVVRDGIDNLDTDIMNASNIPAEAAELEHPVRIWANRLRTDSGGAGQHRGGLGIERILELTTSEAVVSHRSDRHDSQPWGLQGGKPGKSGVTYLVRAEGTTEEIPSRKTFVMRRGDRLRMLLPGGGGYGDPLLRDPEAVVRDVLDRKVSREHALADYGVVLLGDGYDLEATKRERASRRAAVAAGSAVNGELRSQGEGA
jgi:N-methylhydantoinase B